MKKCTKCRIEKIDEGFNLWRGKRQSRCRQCAIEYAKKYHAANREKDNAQRKLHYLNNKENELAKQKVRYLAKHKEIREKQNAKAKTPENRERSRVRSLKWQKENKERFNKNLKRYRDNNKEKLLARQYVIWGLKLGVISKPDKCNKCNSMVKLQAHHLDHNKPLEVQWLCKICHMHEHGKLLDIDPKDQI